MIEISKKRELKAIKDSIEHWKRMIEWVKTQNLKDPICSSLMKININENYYGSNCPLCTIFFKYKGDCNRCPLNIKYGECMKGHEKNTWNSIVSSKNWKEWLKHSKTMIKQLESLM